MRQIKELAIVDAESIHSRIGKMVEFFAKGNKSAFGRHASIQSGVLADILGGRLNKPSFDVLHRLLNSYPQIREEWLLFGRGLMLKDEYNPEHLRAHIMGARFHIDDYSREHTLKGIDEALTLYRNSVVYLKDLEPAMKAVESGVYPKFDKSEVEGYYAVLEELDKQIAAAEEIRNEYFALAELCKQRNQAHANPKVKLEPLSLNGFIELPNTKGQKRLIALAAISHIYPANEQGTKTTIELVTANGRENIIIDSSLPYEEVKALIAASAR